MNCLLIRIHEVQKPSLLRLLLGGAPQSQQNGRGRDFAEASEKDIPFGKQAPHLDSFDGAYFHLEGGVCV